MQITQSRDQLRDEVGGQCWRKKLFLLKQRVKWTAWRILEYQINAFLIVKVTKQAQNVLVARNWKLSGIFKKRLTANETELQLRAGLGTGLNSKFRVWTKSSALPQIRWWPREPSKPNQNAHFQAACPPQSDSNPTLCHLFACCIQIRLKKIDWTRNDRWYQSP